MAINTYKRRIGIVDGVDTGYADPLSSIADVLDANVLKAWYELIPLPDPGVQAETAHLQVAVGLP
jgi:hypothetical protein